LKKVLILGAAGFLGSSLSLYFRDFYEVHGTFFNKEIQEIGFLKVDVTQPSKLEEVLALKKPEVVINCIGLANVDECEKRPEASMLMNAIFPASLAKLTSKLGIKLIHISTDHFESEAIDKRNEADPVWPINQYGFSKLLAENYVVNFDTNAIIIRTNFFGLTKDSNHLLGWMVNNFERGISIKGFTDVMFTPVSTNVLGDCINKLLDLNFSGIINISCPEKITKYDFAKLVNFKVNHSRELVEPIKVNVSNLLAERPKNLSLNNIKFENVTNYKIPSIEDMINDIDFIKISNN
jgi:dTDP-4-dehydrorhamnose reductase